MRLVLALAFGFLPLLACGQTTDAVPSTPSAPAPPAPKLSKAKGTAVELQKAVDQLTQSNRDLLDLLKKQQEVLQDMQYDRRLQSRQIQSLEERLEDALYQNTQLQNKVAKLEAEAAMRPAAPPNAEAPPVTQPQAGTVPGVPVAVENPSAAETNPAPAQPTPPPVSDTPTPPPDTYLPKPDTEGAPGTMSWHRLFTLKGDDVRQTDLFHVQGKTWRVVWHNQDKPGKVYENTSALFINAFPKDDTIPQKVCSKLGSGGDSTELQGPGNYFLRIEASGGSWEVAVEDFR